MHILSKSTYMKGRQCPKALWLFMNRRDLLSEIDLRQQTVFDAGKEVGRLARWLFPNGVDCSPASAADFDPSLIATQEAIAHGASVLYEAAFEHGGVLVAVDILVRESDGWHVIEVKRSASIKDDHVQDMALQAHVLKGAGIVLSDISVAYVDTDYVRMGELDTQRLFKVASVKGQVEAECKEVPARVEALMRTLAEKESPEQGIGPHCDDPYPCDFREHCWEHVPAQRSIFDLTRGGKKSWDLYGRGILRLEDIPDEEKLSPTQQVQVDGWKHGKSSIDHQSIAAFVRSLRYPLSHLDFETFYTAVPLYDFTRPYQQVPFQYSVHTQASAEAEPTHRAFLGDGQQDPREALVMQLLEDLGTEGDILTYNVTFERSRLQELARDFPRFADAINGLLPRLKDLMEPFQKRWFYVPAMNGGYSIKDVLPALVPDLDYGSLNVQEGGTASTLFGQLTAGHYHGDIAKLREDLLAYCRMDTLAMVRVLEVLRASTA